MLEVSHFLVSYLNIVFCLKFLFKTITSNFYNFALWKLCEGEKLRRVSVNLTMYMAVPPFLLSSDPVVCALIFLCLIRGVLLLLILCHIPVF